MGHRLHPRATCGVQLGTGLLVGAGWGWLLLGQIADDEITVPIDRPLTLAMTLGCAALVGAAACVSPTLRGLRIRPTEALREQ